VDGVGGAALAGAARRNAAEMPVTMSGRVTTLPLRKNGRRLALVHHSDKPLDWRKSSQKMTTRQ